MSEITQARSLSYPHVPIVEDMARDILDHLPGMHRRIDKIIHDQGKSILENTIFMVSVYERKRFGEDLTTPQLSSELHQQQIESRITAAATAVGSVVISRLSAIGQRRIFFGATPGFSRKQIVPQPETGDKMTLMEWNNEVWAPRYGQRFAEAAILQIYAEPSNDQTTRPTYENDPEAYRQSVLYDPQAQVGADVFSSEDDEEHQLAVRQQAEMETKE